MDQHYELTTLKKYVHLHMAHAVTNHKDCAKMPWTVHDTYPCNNFILLPYMKYIYISIGTLKNHFNAVMFFNKRN